MKEKKYHQLLKLLVLSWLGRYTNCHRIWKVAWLRQRSTQYGCQTTAVKPPKYKVEATAELKTAIAEMAAEVAAKADNRRRVAMGAPLSKRPTVELSEDEIGRAQTTDVAKAEIKESIITQNLTANDVLRELLPSRWEAFKSFQDADEADKLFLKKAREEGIDVIDAAIKFEANRVSQALAEASVFTQDPLVAMTKQSVVPQVK